MSGAGQFYHRLGMASLLLSSLRSSLQFCLNISECSDLLEISVSRVQISRFGKMAQSSSNLST